MIKTDVDDRMHELQGDSTDGDWCQVEAGMETGHEPKAGAETVE